VALNYFRFKVLHDLHDETFFSYLNFRYSMEQMFSVVADVENYYKFVPFCKKSLVYNKKPGYLMADLVIGFPPLSEKYTSQVAMIEHSLVRAECNDGRLFSYLLNNWKFSPGLKDIPQSCVIDFEVSFQFKSAIHSQLANFFFDQLVIQMERAFIDEAEERFGKPAIKSHVLEAHSRLI
jgi:coenzyme Q-binding protein COQ10